MRYVVIKDMAAGNETVGEMWQETKIFDGKATLDEVMTWANFDQTYHPESPSKKRITITKPHEGKGFYD